MLDDNTHDVYVLLQLTLHMPKPMYPMTFKSTSEPSQNRPSLVQSNNVMKLGMQPKNTVSQITSINHADVQDYNMSPPLIRHDMCLFKPSTLDTRSTLLNIDSLVADPLSHEDELVPGTTLPVPILNDRDNHTHTIEYKTAALVIITPFPLKQHETSLFTPTPNGWGMKSELESEAKQYMPTKLITPSLIDKQLRSRMKDRLNGTHSTTSSNLEWLTSRPDTPVTYSVLVDMPMDIAYNEKTRYNCE
jgi:hypothetical protein